MADAVQDRLSALPDVVLLSILSRVPTLTVVRTSVLSRRWRYLWSSIGVLDFVESDYCSEFYRSSLTRKRKRAREVMEESRKKSRFVEFVDKVLDFHDTPALRKFRLSCDDFDQDRPVEDWVRIAVTRGVRELDLHVETGLLELPELSLEAPLRLPSQLFVSQTLVDLKLDLDMELKLPEAVGLASLRSMHLSHIIFRDNHETRRFFSSCTGLISLALVDCYYRELGRLEISSPLLESLIMNTQRYHGFESCMVKISAPQLTCFKYQAPLAKAYNLGCLPFLIDVEVKFLDFELLEDLTYDQLHRVYEFLRHHSRTKKLKICEACVEALSKIPGSIWQSSVTFFGLNALAMVVGRMDYTVLSRLMMLLVASHRRLKTLKVQFLGPCFICSESNGKEDYQKVLKVYSGLASGVLKEVHIRCDNLTRTILDLVRILLENQPLQKLLLLAKLSSNKGVDRFSRIEALMQTVLSFPRRSRDLAVAFV